MQLEGAAWHFCGGATRRGGLANRVRITRCVVPRGWLVLHAPPPVPRSSQSQRALPWPRVLNYPFLPLPTSPYLSSPLPRPQVLIENYLEYYHLPAVHPDLCNVSGVDEHRRNQGRGMYMGFATDPLTKGGTPLDPGRLPPFPTIKVRSELRSAPSTRCKAPSTCVRAASVPNARCVVHQARLAGLPRRARSPASPYLV